MMKRISMAIVMALLVPAMSVSFAAADGGSGSGNGGIDPN